MLYPVNTPHVPVHQCPECRTAPLSVCGIVMGIIRIGKNQRPDAAVRLTLQLIDLTYIVAQRNFMDSLFTGMKSCMKSVLADTRPRV